MSKEEAIQAMKEGKKITHRFFEPGEYITMKGQEIIMEDCIHVFEWKFWEDRKGFGWNDGYSIYKDKK